MNIRVGTSVHLQDDLKLHRSNAHENFSPVLAEADEPGKDCDVVVEDHQT